MPQAMGEAPRRVAPTIRCSVLHCKPPYRRWPQSIKKSPALLPASLYEEGWEQGSRSSQVVSLSRRQKETSGIAKRIAGGVYLGGQPALAAPYGVCALFLRAPARC